MRLIARLLLSLCLVLALRTPTLSQGSTTIRVASVPSDQVTAVLYAKESGIFQKAGLDVQVTRMSSGAAIASAVVGGSVDVGMAAVVSIIQAHSRGVPLVFIAPTTYYSADHRDSGILVLSDAPLRDARDLIGKSVGVSSLQDIFTLSLMAWLDRNKVDPQTVHFLEIPPPTAMAALQQGRVDASIVYQPAMQQALDTGKFRVLGYPLDAMGPRPEVAAWFTTSAWAESHRDAVQRFGRAITEASRYIAAHENEDAPLLASFTGIDAGVIRHMTRPGRALYLEPAQIQPFIDAAAKFKFIPAAFSATEIISPYAVKPGR